MCSADRSSLGISCFLDLLLRRLLDSGKCIELSGDRVLSALTQYETLLPRLLSDLDLALQNITLIEPHLSRAQLNAAVLWATEWGLEHHPLAHQVKSAARNLKEQLCAEQLSALAAQAEQCVAAVADWGWRSNRLGKLRFDQSFAPAPVNLLDRENFDVKVTSSGPACVFPHAICCFSLGTGLAFKVCVSHV